MVSAFGKSPLSGQASPASQAPSSAAPRRAKALGKRSLTRPPCEIAIADMHEEYVCSRRAEGLRDSTLRMYAGDLRPWAAWCADRGTRWSARF